MLALVAELAEEAPLLCLVDDAHWLDDASATALVFVARRLAAERVALVFAVRDRETRAFSATGLPELELRGLDAEAAGELLAIRGAALVSVAVRDRLVEWTGGNPLALVELPSVLTAGQLEGREPLPSRLPLTETVQRVFTERAHRLPEPARWALLVAAAEDTGRLAVVLAAAEALGVGPEALDEAERAGLVRVRDGAADVRSSAGADGGLPERDGGRAAPRARRGRRGAAGGAGRGPPGMAPRPGRGAGDQKVVAELEGAAWHTARAAGSPQLALRWSGRPS